MDDRDAFVDEISVGKLIARRLDPVDPWKLALVQRHLVWDEVRMAHLLDSLVAGYPIGSILVCRVRAGSHVLVEAEETRRSESASASTWQLLDGQQRVNALVSIFTEAAGFGRFYLHMTRERIPDDVVTRRRDKRRALDYIAWRAEDEAAGEAVEGRERFLDLSRMHAWSAGREAASIRTIANDLARSPSGVTRIINDIDPSFVDELSDREQQDAARRMARLLHAWTDDAIPVQHFTVDTPEDVLQVFTRINLAGVRLDGEDVFFAAVKTQWHDAEEHLDRVAAASPLLDRITALRLLARLASRARSGDDLYPLRVDRLNGVKGSALINTMRRLADPISPVMHRFGVLGRLLTTESILGHGLRVIDTKLLDHVFGWVAVHPDGDNERRIRSQLRDIETYLTAAQAFRYPTVFLDGFLRLGFAEALAAGSVGDQFPVQRIVQATRSRWEGLRRGRLVVNPLATPSDRQHVLDQNAALFLSIAQRLPYDPPLRDEDEPRRGHRQVEWDHIYPQARATVMRVRADSGFLVHHEYRRLVWSAGNLWALDRPLNNAASDRWPSEKFELIDQGGVQRQDLPSRWPSEDNSSLTNDERSDLLAAEDLLRGGDVDGAMERFRAYSETRGERLFAHVSGLMPDLALFSPTTVVNTEGFEEVTGGDVRAALGLSDLEVEREPIEDANDALDDRFASVLALSHDVGVGAEVRAIVAAVLDLGLVPRPYAGSVMIAPPRNKGRMLFTVWPQASTTGGRLSIYRWAPAITEFFPSIDEARARDRLGPDGYGILERADLDPFLVELRALFSEVNSS
jgi:Protein of unknown function DUF262/Protein of unknown function (DUF1524)